MVRAEVKNNLMINFRLFYFEGPKKEGDTGDGEV